MSSENKKKYEFSRFIGELDADLTRRAVWRQEWSWKVCMCSCRSDAVGHCTEKSFRYFFKTFFFANFSLLYVKPGAGLFPLHCGDGHSSSRVVVDHPLVLVPEHVLRWQEGVLQDADERYKSSLLYPVLVRGEDDCLRSDHVEVNTPRLHFSICQRHLVEVKCEWMGDAF